MAQNVEPISYFKCGHAFQRRELIRSTRIVSALLELEVFFMLSRYASLSFEFIWYILL
jgi:hypothetical protein